MALNITDQQAVKRCLELALNGIGSVSPNPLVGAVIIDNGKIIAEGWHKQFGGIHAEIDAINNAEKNGISSFENLTLAVNLEPCSHFGKQPPCVDTIIEKKFKRVIIGMKDPNPLVAGKGIEKLKEANIDVEVGVLENDCTWINRFFCKYITTQKPFIIMKAAQSLDGCIATKTGESKWITCDESRRRVHVLRNEADAVLIGINTLLEDNPLLDTRFLENSNHNPAAIIFDSKLRIDINSNIVQQAKNRIVIVVHTIDNDDKIKLLLEKNVILIKAKKDENQLIDIEDALTKISSAYKFSSILIEGGSKIFSSFIEKDLVDELHVFIAPMIIGNGLKTFADLDTKELSLSKRFRIAGSVISGTDEHLLFLKKLII